MQNGILDSFAYVPAMNNKLYVRCFYQYFLQDKSAHNEIRDFYAHMALTHERRFARCFCRDSGNITWRYFLYNKKSVE